MKRFLFMVFLWPLAAMAGEFRTVADSGAVLYDAPSRQATPLFIASKDYPLEIITQSGAWLKVRDHTGAFSWVERSHLGARRMVVVTAASAEAHARPEDAAPVTFVAAQDVALEVVEKPTAGWLHVRHADGADGYLRATLVWGD